MARGRGWGPWDGWVEAAGHLYMRPEASTKWPLRQGQSFLQSTQAPRRDCSSDVLPAHYRNRPQTVPDQLDSPGSFPRRTISVDWGASRASTQSVEVSGAPLRWWKLGGGRCRGILTRGICRCRATGAMQVGFEDHVCGDLGGVPAGPQLEGGVEAAPWLEGVEGDLGMGGGKLHDPGEVGD